MELNSNTSIDTNTHPTLHSNAHIIFSLYLSAFKQHTLLNAHVKKKNKKTKYRFNYYPEGTQNDTHENTFLCVCVFPALVQ